MEKVGVLLASAKKRVCQDLQESLGNDHDVRVVGSSHSIRDAMEQTKVLTPEVLVIDYQMIEKANREEKKPLDQLIDLEPGIKIIVLDIDGYGGLFGQRQDKTTAVGSEVI